MMLQTLIITSVACGIVWMADPCMSACGRRQPVYASAAWKPFGMYKGHVLYERTYASGKKSWRYEDKDGDGHIYLGATTLQNEIITPL